LTPTTNKFGILAYTSQHAEISIHATSWTLASLQWQHPGHLWVKMVFTVYLPTWNSRKMKHTWRPIC